MSMNKNGRPTKYKKEYEEQVYKLCLLGATNKEIANFFKVNIDTVYEWKNRHRKFSDALRAGKEVADIEVAHSLYERAKGATYVQEKAFKVKKVIYENGKRVSETEELQTIPTILQDPPDTKALEFWLRNRHPEKWNKDKEIAAKDDATEIFKSFINGALGKENDDSN